MFDALFRFLFPSRYLARRLDRIGDVLNCIYRQGEDIMAQGEELANAVAQVETIVSTVGETLVSETAEIRQIIDGLSEGQTPDPQVADAVRRLQAVHERLVSFNTNLAGTVTPPQPEQPENPNPENPPVDTGNGGNGGAGDGSQT